MVREAGDYFAGGGRLHATLRRLAQRLSSEGIAYALLGGMALGEHGYARMTSAPHRLRDLADVQEIIKTRGLDETFARQLDASVRQAYLELLRAVRTASPETT